MRIAIVTQAYYPTYGGVSEHVWHTASELRRRGHRVWILTSHQGSCPDDDGDVIRIGNNLTIPFNGARVNVTVGFGLDEHVRSCLRSVKPDIVQIHCPFTPTIPLMAVKAAPCPVMGTFHCSSSSTLLYRLFRKPLLKYADSLSGRTAVSECARQYVSSVFPGEYEIIPNGVDTCRFNPGVSPREKFMDSRFNILYVGRLDPRKGIYYLLSAFEQLARKTGPRVRLIIVGAGPHVNLVRRFQSRLGDCLAHEGKVLPELLPHYYTSADAVCCPAIGNESFGIVLLEAMASGKPLVVSDIPGYRAVVTPRSDALIAKPKDPDSLAAALLSLYEDRDLRLLLGRNGRRTALEYSWSKIVTRLEEYFSRRVLGETGRLHGTGTMGGSDNALRGTQQQREAVPISDAPLQ